ncbi:GNAT family N-acetyltransferase [Reinekea marinisedimentorum]|uniref:Ribosomal protein S18 acetylase RimI-like enzyme n=1 Tax=Reinekea marinisedimentorum TaxID=230495 RepID=A0A4R3HRN0_9GAMM|nr:GNAT family N-acetyltransferase [Reinekea marinisedimentorum]TCS34665.1 ribosomal protein S18 acetylase RimI-like enzyme [Reinekea marinisedimentorum]
MEVQLVKAISEDFEFAYSAKKDALGPHIISKWGWDEEYQREVHFLRWKEKPWFLIVHNGEKVGTVSLLKQDDGALRFGEFYIFSAYRRRGIGSFVLRRVLSEADSLGQNVVLEYLKWNPVGELYRRNGFKVVAENDIHYFMERAKNF